MKMHFWERIEHRLHRHEPSSIPPPETPGTELRGRERFQTWLSRLAENLPHFDSWDKDDSSKPH